jgi:ABC-type dipeptide/oligopeptide/nickel transport system permease component
MTDEIEKLKIRIEDLEENRKKDIKETEEKRREQYIKWTTNGFGLIMGSLVYFPIVTIVEKLGVTVESSIIGMIIGALFGLIIAVETRKSL